MSLTYEGVLELFRETDQRIDQRFQETAQQFRETAQQFRETAQQFRETDQRIDQRFQETDRKISALGSRIGEIVENMIGSDIVAQFQALGYAVTAYSRNKVFGQAGTSESGEIDLLLEDGDVVILIEAKTTLKTADVLEHIERLKKYRRYIDKKNHMDRRKFIGAVAGAVVEANVVQFAQNHGLYVIVQSGKAVEIITPPEGFTAKKW